MVLYDASPSLVTARGHALAFFIKTGLAGLMRYLACTATQLRYDHEIKKVVTTRQKKCLELSDNLTGNFDSWNGITNVIG